MFGFIVNFFNTFLYLPLFNLLVVFYNYIPGHDFGLAIIALTILIRFLLYPLSVKAVNSQTALQKLQPQVKEIQKKYKDDKEKLAKETLELYKKEKINPFSGLFLAFIQLPVLIALYNVFWRGLKPEALANIYTFISNPGVINPIFLGFIDLSKPNLILAIFAGITQFFQTKMLTPATKTTDKAGDFSNMMQKQMLYFFPVITVVVLLGLPSALGLYWTVSGVFSIIQQYIILKKKPQNDRPT